jgi:hypothetical protein
MNGIYLSLVIPAKAGIHAFEHSVHILIYLGLRAWIPAFAGMTNIRGGA